MVNPLWIPNKFVDPHLLNFSNLLALDREDLNSNFKKEEKKRAIARLSII
jgi:hypothetical protein